MEIKALPRFLILPEQAGDMRKPVDKDKQINNIRLLYRTGGSGSTNFRQI